MATTDNPEITRLRQESGRVTAGADELTRIAEQVLAGTKDQFHSLDDASGAASQMAASLKETATQAATVAGAAEQLASSANEMASES